MFCRSLFVLYTLSFGHCVVCSSSIDGFWLPPWYLQALHTVVDILNESWIYQRCMEMSDEIKQTRLIIIQRLNGKEITLDIVVKHIAIFFLQNGWNSFQFHIKFLRYFSVEKFIFNSVLLFLISCYFTVEQWNFY